MQRHNRQTDRQTDVYGQTLYRELRSIRVAKTPYTLSQRRPTYMYVDTGAAGSLYNGFATLIYPSDLFHKSRQESQINLFFIIPLHLNADARTTYPAVYDYM